MNSYSCFLVNDKDVIILIYDIKRYILSFNLSSALTFALFLTILPLIVMTMDGDEKKDLWTPSEAITASIRPSEGAT